MALTVTMDRGYEVVQGGTRRNRLTLALDTSYPIGGYSLTPRNMGLVLVHEVQIQPQSAFLFNYDITNQKLRVFRSAAQILVNEGTGAFAAGVAYTSKYVPGYVCGVRGVAGSTGPKLVIPSSKTPGAGQVAVNLTTGAFTWGDAGITQAQLLYIPLGVPGFTSDLQVIEESVTVAALSGTLANAPACIHSIWDNGAAVPLTIIPLGGTVGANQCTVNLSTGVITLNAANAGPLLVTYFKRTGNPLNLGPQGNKGVNAAPFSTCGPTTDTSLMTTGGQAAPTYALPAFGCQACGIQANGVSLISGQLLVDPAGPVQAGSVVWNYFANSFKTADADNYSGGSFHTAWLYLAPENVGDYLQELGNGTNLTAITGVRAIALGV